MPCTRYALNPRENPARVTTVTSFLQIGTLRHRRLHTRPAGARPRFATDNRITATSRGSGSSAREKSPRRSHLQGPRICRWPAVFTPAFGAVLTPAGWATWGNVGGRGSRSYNITSPSARKTKMSTRQVQLALWQEPQPPGGPAGSVAMFHLCIARPAGVGHGRKNCRRATSSQNTPGPAGSSASGDRVNTCACLCMNTLRHV